MRVLVISDTHSKHTNLEEVLKREPPFDLVIHLGDAEGFQQQISEMVNCPLEIVAGNCDFLSHLEQEKIIQVGSYQAFITHGHYYNVNAGYEDIKKEARGRGCDIVMFGHTHRPIVEYGKNVITINPGSLSYPRQDGRRPSYIVMNLEDFKKAEILMHYL